MPKRKKKSDEVEERKSDRSLFDQKCPTCGSWMEEVIKKSKKNKSVEVVTYSCSECGLSYTIQR